MARFGVEFVPMDVYWKTVYHAILAEKSGFDYVWVTDHYNNRNVYVLLTSIALYTRRINFGPGVTNPYLIHPVVTGQALVSLNEIALGRVVCGMGPGDKTTLEMVIPEYGKPLTYVKESVEVIRSLVNTGSVKYEGIVFKVPNARLNFKPNPIRIFIGAQGPKMLALAAEIGDGVMINASHPKDYETALRHVGEAAEKAGKKMEQLEIVGATSLSIAEKAEDAQKAAVPVVSFIVAGCPPPILESHGIKPEAALQIKEAIMKGQWKEAFSKVTSEMLEAFCISGTPQTCIEKIDRLLKLGVTLLVAGSPIGPNVRKSIGLLSREVLPRFR